MKKFKIEIDTGQGFNGNFKEFITWKDALKYSSVIKEALKNYKDYYIAGFFGIKIDELRAAGWKGDDTQDVYCECLRWDDDITDYYAYQITDEQYDFKVICIETKSL